MKMTDIPFFTTDWSAVPESSHTGINGEALWKVVQAGDVRVRTVRYTPGYCADHWCSKGHILFVLEGELKTELQDGRTFILRPGMSYQVADDSDPHRSSTETGALLFIVD